MRYPTISLTGEQFDRIAAWVKWPDAVVILVETWAERVAQRTGLVMPGPKSYRKVQARERQGRVIAVGPEARQCQVGDNAWFVRYDADTGKAGQNVRIDGAEAIVVPEGNVLMVRREENAPCPSWTA